MERILTLILMLPSLILKAQFGMLDPTFGTGGVVRTEIEPPSLGYAVAVQPDGRILVGGTADSASVIVRYMPDGSLDASFGTNGVVIHSPVAGPGGREHTITELIVLNTGKILVAGRSTYYLTSPLQQLHLTRFNSNGTVDVSFGGNGNGRVSINLSSQDSGSAWELLVQPDGRILLQGTRTAVTTGSSTYRLLANGTFDNSFATGGEALWGWVAYTHTYGRCLALQPDGKVLVGGWLATPSESDRFVRRLTAQGELDPTYGTAGLVLLDEGTGYMEMVSDILLQADGKLLVLGSVSTPTEQRFRVTRLSPDGSIDPSYGTNGHVIGPVVNGTIEPKRGRLQTDGKLVFAAHVTSNGTTRSVLWRLDPDGQPDASFGTDGQVSDPYGSGASRTNHLAQQGDGKLLLCGQGPGSSQLTVARLTSGDPVGIGGPTERAAVRLHPNPATDQVVLGADLVFDRVEVMDAWGRTWITTQIATAPVTIDVRDLPSGTYFVRTFGPEKSHTFPFVKTNP